VFKVNLYLQVHLQDILIEAVFQSKSQLAAHSLKYLNPVKMPFNLFIFCQWK